MVIVYATGKIAKLTTLEICSAMNTSIRMIDKEEGCSHRFHLSIQPLSDALKQTYQLSPPPKIKTPYWRQPSGKPENSIPFSEQALTQLYLFKFQPRSPLHQLLGDMSKKETEFQLDISADNAKQLQSSGNSSGTKRGVNHRGANSFRFPSDQEAKQMNESGSASQNKQQHSTQNIAQHYQPNRDSQA